MAVSLVLARMRPAFRFVNEFIFYRGKCTVVNSVRLLAKVKPVKLVIAILRAMARPWASPKLLECARELVAGRQRLAANPTCI